MRLLARVVLVAVLGATVSSSVAHADPHQWIDDEVTDLVDTRLAGGHLRVEKRSMIYGSGYLYTALTAVYRPARGHERRTLLAEGPTMCSGARQSGSFLVVEMCTERFGDTREVVTWRLDRATGRFIAGRPSYRSPYAERARGIVDDLRAGRESRALAALDDLGNSPDGHAEITWWWSAQRLVADWPAITRARPADARKRLAPHIQRLLAVGDAGEISIHDALAADLTAVPRCGYEDVGGGHRAFRVRGPRKLEPMVKRAIALLGTGDADEVALAAALAAALRPPPSR